MTLMESYQGRLVWRQENVTEEEEEEADHTTSLRWGKYREKQLERWGVIPSRPARICVGGNTGNMPICS